jgi:hypothetical protein
VRVWIADEGHRQGHPLLLTAGELRRAPLAQFRDPHLGEHQARSCRRASSAHRPAPHQLADRQRPRETHRLLHHSEVVAPGRRPAGIPTTHPNGSRLHSQQPRRQPDHRGLARPVRAEQCDALAGDDCQAHPMQSGQRTEATPYSVDLQYLGHGDHNPGNPARPAVPRVSTPPVTDVNPGSTTATSIHVAAGAGSASGQRARVSRHRPTAGAGGHRRAPPDGPRRRPAPRCRST